jgi:DtxR family Mn-dependent transcriptional regulator
VWHSFETGVRRQDAVRQALEQAVDDGIYARLLSEGFLREKDGDVLLTPRGEHLAKDITRRHRLAERLLSDVLSLEHAAIDPNACQLEHILSPEVAQSICTLLGHPKECPHGSAIPAGPCCQKAEDHVEPIVVPLNRMTAGEDGQIAYLLLHHHPELHKLLSLGVVPGTHVRLHQTFPTYVLDLGESQLALEESIAQNIYVRRG